MTNHWDIEIALIHLGQECDSTVKTVEEAFLAIGKMTERALAAARHINKLERRNIALEHRITALEHKAVFTPNGKLNTGPFDAQKEVVDPIIKT